MLLLNLILLIDVTFSTPPPGFNIYLGPAHRYVIDRPHFLKSRRLIQSKKLRLGTGSRNQTASCLAVGGCYGHTGSSFPT